MPTEAEWIAQRITRSEAMVIVYENALEALAGGAQQYSFDTGQSRQTVTKADMSQLRETLKFWEQRRKELLNDQASLSSGGGSTYVRPEF
jgi:hypothetical protein